MEQIKFECEVVTPMFLGGADQQAELRPPSIRGAMRWWFRAMMGGNLFGRSRDFLKEVKDIEDATFGSTSGQGSFSLSVEHNGIKEKDFSSLNGFFLTYLGFGLKDNKRRYIPPLFPFDVVFRFHSSDSQIKKLVLATFWMLSNFGNLGARATRGFGSFIVKTPLGDNLPIVESADKLEEGLRCVAGEKYFNIPSTPTVTTVPAFSIVYPGFWQCIVPTNSKFQNSDAVLLMNTIGKEFRLSRENTSSPFMKTIGGKTIKGFHTNDYAAISKWSPPPAGAPGTTIPSQTAFGLPHQFQGSGGLKIMVEGENRSRRTSPLHIHVHKFGKTYSVSFQVFKSQFLDSNIKIRDMNNATRTEILGGTPSYSDLDAFMKSLSPKKDIVL